MADNRAFMRSRLFWRHSFVQPKLGPLDYRAIFVIMPFMFYIRLWTLGLLAFILIMMWLLQTRKIEPDNILRYLRAMLAGPERTAQGIRRLRVPVDYGFETQKDVENEIRRQKRIREFRKTPKYKGRKYPDPAILGPSRIKPLRERFTTVRPG